MARIKGALMTRKRRKKTLKMAKGYWGRKSTNYRIANQAVMKSLTYAYTGRKLKKRDFRRLWITRISAACKCNDINYSRFMNGLKKSGVGCQRSRRLCPAGGKGQGCPVRAALRKKTRRRRRCSPLLKRRGFAASAVRFVIFSPPCGGCSAYGALPFVGRGQRLPAECRRALFCGGWESDR